MLTVSLLLHAGLAAGIVLSSIRGLNPVALVSETAGPSVMLWRATAAPAQEVHPSPPVKAIDRPLAVAEPGALPALAKALPKTTPTAPPPVLEANPNAHLQALPTEAVLSPTPAPRLNGSDGVVFILDISGSMYEPYAGSTRLAIARQTLARQIRALKDGTPFAITFYALRACNSGPLVAANEAARETAVRYLMRDVDCGGGTNLPAGLISAQQLHPGTLVLASDGDLNISAFNLTAKAHDILGPSGHGPKLAIVGIAPRASQRAERLLQDLADQQGGTYTAAQADDVRELVTASGVKPASVTP
jgi:hypothetical protein